MLCRRCTSDWYYVIGTSPRSARSKLRFLSFCDQNPWKDVKSSIVFFWICIHGWLNFSSKIGKNKGDRDFNIYIIPFLQNSAGCKIWTLHKIYMLHVTKKIKNWCKCAIKFASLTLDYQISLVMSPWRNMSIIVSYCKFQMITIELMLNEIQHYTESDWYIVTIIMFTVFSICRICQNMILKPFKYLQRVEGQWAIQ